uniref:Uncharacterized protein n=1 Tax=Arundo donax TaxID=35708 RepID=A0A0A9EEM2_ARUDO
MRSLQGFASQSKLNAHSLDIHLHESCRPSIFDSSDPMMKIVLTPASGSNSASSTYFRSLHSPRIPSGKPN